MTKVVEGSGEVWKDGRWWLPSGEKVVTWINIGEFGSNFVNALKMLCFSRTSVVGERN